MANHTKQGQTVISFSDLEALPVGSVLRVIGYYYEKIYSRQDHCIYWFRRDSMGARERLRAGGQGSPDGITSAFLWRIRPASGLEYPTDIELLALAREP